jgi:hypothetical protein
LEFGILGGYHTTIKNKNKKIKKKKEGRRRRLKDPTFD